MIKCNFLTNEKICFLNDDCSKTVEELNLLYPDLKFKQEDLVLDNKIVCSSVCYIETLKEFRKKHKIIINKNESNETIINKIERIINKKA